MCMRHFFLSFILFAVVFIPFNLRAQTITVQDLLLQIQELVRIVEDLQKQLNILQEKEKQTTKTETVEVQEISDVPTVSFEVLPGSITPGQPLYRFKVINNTNTDIEWKKISLKVATTSAVVKDLYFTRVGKTSIISKVLSNSNSEGVFDLYVGNTYTSEAEIIQKGKTISYDVYGQVYDWDNGGQIYISIPQDTTEGGQTTLANAQGSFIWSKGSHDIFDTMSGDWQTGFGVISKDTKQTYSKTVLGKDPVIINATNVTDTNDLLISGSNFTFLDGGISVYVNEKLVTASSTSNNYIVVRQSAIDIDNGTYDVYIKNGGVKSNTIKVSFNRTPDAKVGSITQPISEVGSSNNLVLQGSNMQDTSFVIVGNGRFTPNSVSASYVSVNNNKLVMPNGTYDVQLVNSDGKLGGKRSVVINRPTPVITSASNVTDSTDLVITGTNLNSNPVIVLGGFRYDASSHSSTQMTLSRNSVSLQNGSYSVSITDVWGNTSNAITITITR